MLINLDALLTEHVNPGSRDIDTRPTGDILRIMNEEDRNVASAVASEIPRIALAVDRIVDVIGKGGRLFYIGAGTSGRLGVLDAAECPPTFNVSPDVVQGRTGDLPLGMHWSVLPRADERLTCWAL
jgi:N-acetylmuramic acid 6-phosphate etherase